MLERAEQELRDLRNLLASPHAENCTLIQQKLEYLASFLSAQQVSLRAGVPAPGAVRDFLNNLPLEMAAVRVLLEAPARFFQKLISGPAEESSAYGRTGMMILFPARSGITVQL